MLLEGAPPELYISEKKCSLQHKEIRIPTQKLVGPKPEM